MNQPLRVYQHDRPEDNLYDFIAFALKQLDPIERQLVTGPISAIEALLSEDLTIHESWCIKISVATAVLFSPKTLDSFDYGFQVSLDSERIHALAGLDFIERKEVLHLLGPP